MRSIRYLLILASSFKNSRWLSNSKSKTECEIKKTGSKQIYRGLLSQEMSTLSISLQRICESLCTVHIPRVWLGNGVPCQYLGVRKCVSEGWSDSSVRDRMVALIIGQLQAEILNWIDLLLVDSHWLTWVWLVELPSWMERRDLLSQAKWAILHPLH